MNSSSAKASSLTAMHVVIGRSRGSHGDLSEDPEAVTSGAARTDSAFAPTGLHFPAHPLLESSSSDDDDIL
jgi:hypothetical protein